MVHRFADADAGGHAIEDDAASSGGGAGDERLPVFVVVRWIGDERGGERGREESWVGEQCGHGAACDENGGAEEFLPCGVVVKRVPGGANC